MASGRKTCMGMVPAAVAAVALAGCVRFTPTAAVSQLSMPADRAETVAQKHFVTNWLLLGPFMFEEGDFGGGHQQPAADEAFVPREGGLNGTQEAPEGTAWAESQFEADPNYTGRVNLNRFYKRVDHAAAYAVCWLYSPDGLRGARLLVGSDDYIKVWINGKLVHTYKEERRAGDADQDTVEGVTLKKGYNRVVVKCVDVVLSWDFYLRLTDADGRPVAVTPGPPAE